MICCSEIYNYCFVDKCTELVFDNATETTTLKAVFSFAGIVQTRQINIVTGQPIIVYITGLNESACYNLIFKKNNEKYLIKKDGIDYDCIKFKTYIDNEII